jgi:hypothetical protein
MCNLGRISSHGCTTRRTSFLWMTLRGRDSPHRSVRLDDDSEAAPVEYR